MNPDDYPNPETTKQHPAQQQSASPTNHKQDMEPAALHNHTENTARKRTFPYNNIRTSPDIKYTRYKTDINKPQITQTCIPQNRKTTNDTQTTHKTSSQPRQITTKQKTSPNKHNRKQCALPIPTKNQKRIMEPVSPITI